MAPPTFVTEYESAWTAITSPRTASVTVAVGDILVILVGVENGQSAPTHSASGVTGVTWSSTSVGTTTNDAAVTALVSTAATVAGTYTLSVTRLTGSTSNIWGFNCLRFSGASGVAIRGSVVNGGQTWAAVTANANSALAWIAVDWNAIDGAARSYVTATAGAFTEQTYFRNTTNYGVYAGFHADAGAAGTKTIGLSTPTGVLLTGIAVEVFGSAGGTTPVTSTVASAWSTSSKVTDTAASAWSVRALVEQSKAAAWTIRTPVTDTVAAAWSVRTVVQQSKASAWSLRSQVQQSKAAAWNVLSQAITVTSTAASAWSTRAQVSSSKAAAWTVWAQVAQSKVSAWTVRTAVQQTKGSAWNVLSPGTTSVTSTKAAAWSARAMITDTVAAAWSVRARISASRPAAWNVTVPMTANRATSWAVRVQLTTTRGAAWAARAYITAALQAAWVVHIERGLMFTPPPRLDSFVVRDLTSHGVHHLFDRLARPHGVSLLKTNGTYRQVEGPTDEDMAAADITYLGGHTYTVTRAEGAELTEAGYGAWVAEAVDA